MQYICCYCPERIILGGGVMHIEKLFPMIREKTLSYLNGYIDTGEIQDIDSYITPAGLMGKQGIKGALFLASLKNELVFEGIDTIGEVYLNGSRVYTKAGII